MQWIPALAKKVSRATFKTRARPGAVTLAIVFSSSGTVDWIEFAAKDETS
jgi:hypothetical protein